jgi:hypothetical protein
MPQLANGFDHAGSAISDQGVRMILSQLKQLLAEHHPIRNLLLQLANRLAISKACETRDISTIIIQLLADNIKRGEVTPRYIHHTPPELFKRQYCREREPISLLKVNKTMRKNPPDYTISRRERLRSSMLR